MVKQYMDTPTDITKTGPSTPGYSVGMDLSGETAIMKADAAQTVPSPAAIGTATGQNAGIVAATSEPVVGSGTALQAGLKSTSVDWGTLAGAGAKETGVSDAALDIAPNVVLNPGELGSITSDAIGANIKAEALIGARLVTTLANFCLQCHLEFIASGAAGSNSWSGLGKWHLENLTLAERKKVKHSWNSWWSNCWCCCRDTSWWGRCNTRSHYWRINRRYWSTIFNILGGSNGSWNLRI
jgi:hypothetical protein